MMFDLMPRRPDTPDIDDFIFDEEITQSTK